MRAEVTVTGPLFERPVDAADAERVGLARAADLAEELLRGQLGQRSRYRTPIYGHAAEQVSTRTRRAGAGLEATIAIRGQASFLGPILEGGSRAHPIPDVRVRGTGNRRRLVRGGSGTPLHFQRGGGPVFLQSVNHPGTPAYHVFEHASAALVPQLQPIFEQAVAEWLRG